MSGDKWKCRGHKLLATFLNIVMCVKCFIGIWHLLCHILFSDVLIIYTILLKSVWPVICLKVHLKSVKARLAIDYTAYSMVICQVIDKLKLIYAKK